jgi:hypothetical protein
MTVPAVPLMDRAWLDEICDDLALADDSPTLILIDRACDAQLPSLLRAVAARFGEAALATTVRELRALPAHQIVVFAPDLSEFEALNRARPMLRELRLRVLCWCDSSRSRLLAERASDVYDWISRYVECPPVPHSLALWQMRRWEASAEPYVELRGADWRAVLDGMHEPWIEVPYDVLDDYQRTVAFVRAHKGHRIASRAPGDHLDYFAGVRLIAAALTEQCPLPVTLVGAASMRWFKAIDSVAPSVSEIIEARRDSRASLPIAELAALGRELLSNEAPSAVALPVPTAGDAKLEAAWDRFDEAREGNHPIGMDPSYRLLSLSRQIGSGRSTRVVPVEQWWPEVTDWELLQLSDIYAHWASEGLQFVRANPEFVRALLINAEERSILELAPLDTNDATTAPLALLERLQRALFSGDYASAQRWLAAQRAPSANVADEFERWFAPYAQWLAGASRASDALPPLRDLPPMLAWLAEQERLDRKGDGEHLRSRSRFDRVEIDATEEWLPLVHMARYDERVVAPHVEEPNDVAGEQPTTGEARGRLIDLRARVLRGELATEQREFDVAERQFTAGIANMRRWLGDAHPMTLVSRAMHGRMFALLGAHERALSLLDHAANALDQQLGALHADTLRVRLELARVRANDTRVLRARVGLIEQLEARFGDESPLVRSARALFRTP